MWVHGEGNSELLGVTEGWKALLKELKFISRAIGKELWKGLSRFEFLKGLPGCEVMSGLDGKLEVRGGEKCREDTIDNGRKER